MQKRVYISVVWFLLVLAANAQPLIIFNNSDDGGLVARKMFLYEDKSGSATINDVSENAASFTQSASDVPQYFSTRSAIWLKANIRIETTDPVYLQFDFPMMDTVELYITGPDNKIVEHKMSGAFIPLSSRDLLGVYPKFRLKKGLYTYYIRVKATY